MKKSSISLIGFMATGKTTVGKALVNSLGHNYRFVETDQIIVEIVGKSIPQIFEEDGEKKFREYETEACKKASIMEKVIISCGGGVVLNKINIDYLRQKSRIILLKASIEELFRRIMKNGKESRPVINKRNPKKELDKVLKKREKLYNSYAELIIDTNKKSIEDIVKEIIKQLNKV